MKLSDCADRQASAGARTISVGCHRTLTSPAEPARGYDYLLGGANSFDVDRDLAEKLVEIMPDSAFVVIKNGVILGRAVQVRSEAGIGQVLDLGSGIPTVGQQPRDGPEDQPGLPRRSRTAR